MARDDDGVYCIKIDFRPGTPDPSRVFRAMTQLIGAFGHLDRALASAIGADVRPTVLLEDIDKGSLRAWLKNALEEVDDEDLHDLNVRRMAGKFLVKAKRAVIRRLADSPTIGSRDDLRAIQGVVNETARDAGVASLPTYTPVAADRLLRAASDVSEAVGNLAADDTATFISDEGDVPIGREFGITGERIEELLTRETVTSQAELILKVKKPDYLGLSMWDLRHDQHTVQAKIEDIGWLRRFQDRLVDVRPGDSLRAWVRTDIKYGFQSEVVALHHTILEVREVIPLDRDSQLGLAPPSGE